MIEKIELIESFNEYKSKIPNGINYIVEKLRTNDVSSAIKVIIEFSEGLVWMVDAAKVLKDNGVEVQLDYNEIEGFLEEINQGIEKQDFILVADIFEYELLEFFGNVQSISTPQ